MERRADGSIKVVGKRLGPEDTLPDVISRVRGKEILSHFDNIQINDVQPLCPNTLYVGSRIMFQIPKWKVVGKINVHDPRNGRRGGYYRGRSDKRAYNFYKPEMTRELRTRREKVVTITFNDSTRILKGIYWIERKSLLIADITGYTDGYNLLMEVLTALKAQYGLTEKPSPRVKKIKLPRVLVTVGCDPEYEALSVDRKRVVAPNADERNGGTHPSSEIGIDGAGDQIEIRPKPALRPETVVKNMRDILSRIRHPLTTVGNRYPLGGHVHVGVGAPYTPPTDLLFVLDELIGKPTLSLSGMARGAYRGLGKYETKPWGFEYRTPPGAIFTYPEFARIAMKIVKFVVQAYVNGDVIIVHSPAVDDDYRVCLTRRDLAIWKRCFADYISQTMAGMDTLLDIVPFWVKRVILPDEASIPSDTTQADIPHEIDEDWVGPPISRGVEFGDDWRPEVQEIFRNQFRTVAETHGTIVFYGLRADRGNVVAGISSNFIIGQAGYDIQFTPLLGAPPYPFVSNGRCRIGIPFGIRMDMDLGTVQGFVRELSERIQFITGHN